MSAGSTLGPQATGPRVGWGAWGPTRESATAPSSAAATRPYVQTSSTTLCSTHAGKEYTVEAATPTCDKLQIRHLVAYLLTHTYIQHAPPASHAMTSTLRRCLPPRHPRHAPSRGGPSSRRRRLCCGAASPPSCCPCRPCSHVCGSPPPGVAPPPPAPPVSELVSAHAQTMAPAPAAVLAVGPCWCRCWLCSCCCRSGSSRVPVEGSTGVEVEEGAPSCCCCCCCSACCLLSQKPGMG